MPKTTGRGANLPRRDRVERRLAAILAADVVGFSRMIGVDEVGVLERLRELRDEIVEPLISGQGGRIFKLMGDGLLAEFPSVVLALRAAIDIQRSQKRRNADIPADRRLELRIAVHQGDVVIEKGDLLGDGVNVAARLESLAQAGGICISARVYEDAVGNIAFDAGDMGELKLKNIARPVRVYQLNLSPTEAGAEEKEGGPGHTTLPGALARAKQGAAAENAQTDTTILPGTDAIEAPRLSVAVLPFVNVGGNTEHDHFVDSITETLTTDLSCISELLVISRNTTGNYKGRPIDTRRIGLELGVRYVLKGSVQSAGKRIRINAQLIDAESGAHLWAERFDKPYADLLDTQDEVAARLARTIHVELIAAESRRATREHADRLDSLDHALNGWAAWNQPLSLEAARKARGFFEAALRLDEHNVSALLGLANAHMWEVNMYVSDDREAQIRAAEAAAAKALAMNPNAADVHVTYGTVLFAMRAPERALREFELAVSLDGNLALAHGYLGLMKFFLGRACETRSHISEAMRLSPRDPLLFHWHFFIGVADLYLGRMGSALESLRKSVEINPNWGLSQFVLAGALALKELPAEAAEVCAAARRLSPNFTIAKFRAEAVSDNPVYLAQRERLHEGLRLAGVPER
jgi:TolB-like protein/class 3 adenylate cyclase